MAETPEEREERWIDWTAKPYQHVPANLYDEHQKLSEMAVGEMLEEIRVLREALERFVTFGQVAVARTPAGHWVWKAFDQRGSEQHQPIVNWFGPLDFGRVLDVFFKGEPVVACAHSSVSFDRSLCACGEMHNYCDDCGRPIGCRLEDG